MRLLLIRHGETVDNVAQVYAGVRDSALTVHGSLQADRLGRYLTAKGLAFTDIFSSDLQRALNTAKAISKAQSKAKVGEEHHLKVQRLPLLREQDFGFYEGKPFYTKSADSKVSGKDDHRARYANLPGFKDVESKEAMAERMNTFLDQSLMPLLQHRNLSHERTIAIVSHGIILSVLWKVLLQRFPPQSVKLAPSLNAKSGGYAALEHLGGWSNTGYLDLNIKVPEVLKNDDRSTEIVSTQTYKVLGGGKISLLVPKGWTMTIKAINSKDHLKHLKRTGGGVGSSKYDEGQKSIESFFKKRRT